MNTKDEYGKITFSYVDDSQENKISIHGDSTLDDVLTAFESFLRSVGYVFDGELIFSEGFETESEYTDNVLAFPGAAASPTLTVESNDIDFDLDKFIIAGSMDDTYAINTEVDYGDIKISFDGEELPPETYTFTADNMAHSSYYFDTERNK